jgi:predicted nucleic acid-binding protein
VAELEVFLDSSALFAAVHSASGGARLILQLGEAGVVSLWIGRRVLQEVEAALERKSPRSKAYMALLLNRARVHVGTEPDASTIARAMEIVGYLPDAQVLAEAMTISVDYFVTFDGKHLLGHLDAAQLAFPVGTAGDFLSWYRGQLLAKVGP